MIDLARVDFDLAEVPLPQVAEKDPQVDQVAGNAAGLVAALNIQVIDVFLLVGYRCSR